MRTKLFLAFLAVMLLALVSNLIFERLIIRDFGEYTAGQKEDRIYWVLASVEGSYEPAAKGEGGWNGAALANAVHWAMMLGWDVEVRDSRGERIATSRTVMDSLPFTMKKRMEALVDMTMPEDGEFEEYPLYMEGEEIGFLYVRPIARIGPIAEREKVFRQRGSSFLLISFLIAGGGAFALSVLFSLFLTRPVRRLKLAAEAVAGGDLSVRVAGGSRDELGLLSESFNRMVETLQREDALRRNLTQNIAHELRTPLAVMKAHIEAMEDGIVRADTGGLRDIRAEVERLIGLVEGIEDVTRAEASFFKRAEYGRVLLGELVGGISRAMRPLFEAKGISLEVKGGELYVVTDAERLEAALRNILSNSLRHTESGRVAVSYGEEKSYFFFVEVRDTGEGIPEEDLAKIFERFYSRGGRTGLGLSISKELVEAMGGKIEAKSRPGEGSVFRIVLPRQAVL